MSEVPLYCQEGGIWLELGQETNDPLQGNLAHKKPPPPRTLQQDHAQGLMGVLVG